MRRLLCAGLLLLVPWLVQADTVSRYLTKSPPTTLLSTELNGLANNAHSAVSGFVDNLLGGAVGEGYLLCEFELTATFGTIAVPANPTAGTAPIVWLLRCPDGTNCEPTPTATVTLGRRPDLTLPVVAGQALTRVVQEIRCPPGIWKAVLKNDGTGVQFKENGNTLKVRWVTIQAIP